MTRPSLDEVFGVGLVGILSAIVGGAVAASVSRWGVLGLYGGLAALVWLHYRIMWSRP